jgi:hypothetical protein
MLKDSSGCTFSAPVHDENARQDTWMSQFSWDLDAHC